MPNRQNPHDKPSTCEALNDIIDMNERFSRNIFG